MPLPASPHLGMTRFAGSDPFLRSDIVADLDIIDQYPGTFICTSTTRPSWSAAQAGMSIQETDTGRELWWTGTGWQVKENYSRVYAGNINISTNLSKGASPAAYVVYNSLTTVRPCTLAVLMTVRVQKPAATPQTINLDPWIDGTSCAVGGGATLNFPDGPSGTTKNHAQVASLIGLRTGVAAGAHDIQLKVSVGTDDDNNITLSWAKALIFLSE